MKLGDKIRDKYDCVHATVIDIKIHKFYKDSQPITAVTYEAIEEEHNMKIIFFGNQIGSKFFKIEDDCEDKQLSFLN